MKLLFWGIEIEISDWNRKLRIASIVFAVLTVLFSALTLFAKITVPGLTPIAMRCTMLLLGIRELNICNKYC